MSQVLVYTTEPCSYCARVKGLLEARGVQFKEVNLSKDPDGRVQLASELGGFNEVRAAAQDGRLDALLAA
jgi:glutaredoxin 3